MESESLGSTPADKLVLFESFGVAGIQNYSHTAVIVLPTLAWSTESPWDAVLRTQVFTLVTINYFMLTATQQARLLNHSALNVGENKHTVEHWITSCQTLSSAYLEVWICWRISQPTLTTTSQVRRNNNNSNNQISIAPYASYRGAGKWAS